MDEKQLVLRARNGDSEAFSSLYTAYKDALYRYAFYRIGNRDAAEDAVSSCVLSAYEQIAKLRNPEAFSAWLFRILYYTCTAEIKALANRRKMAELSGQETVPTAGAEPMIERTELLEALGKLKAEDKNIVLLSVVSGLNSKEIAKICECSPGTVRSRLSRSLKKMRELMGDTYEK